MELTAAESAIAAGREGAAAAMAMRLVAESGAMLGARRLIAIRSAHVDGCLYHGDSGVLFAEKLVAGGGRVAVATTLNVGALDLCNPGRVRAPARTRDMAGRQMDAYLKLGCRATWTCAPYQAGHRPARGTDVAFGESNAVAFVNSVLGARTNRYGDFLDICCALTGRAPCYGLHLAENRRARIVIDTSALAPELKREEAFYAVLGAWLGAEVGAEVAVIDGLPADTSEDRLKALGAAAATTGSVGLFHVAGVTPEAPSVAAACGGEAPRTLRLRASMLIAARERLSTVASGPIRVVAVGSPHFSRAEFDRLQALLAGRRARVPFYVCTRRDLVAELERAGRLGSLAAAGIEIVADTCIAVAPILPPGEGVAMTNSGKFAQYIPSNTGYGVVFGGLADCVESAVAGHVVRDERVWR